MEASKDNLKDAAKELKEKTPPPMNTMLQKQPRPEALQKRDARSKMVTDNIPPTTPGLFTIYRNLVMFPVLMFTFFLVSEVTQATKYKEGKRKTATKM